MVRQLRNFSLLNLLGFIMCFTQRDGHTLLHISIDIAQGRRVYRIYTCNIPLCPFTFALRPSGLHGRRAFNVADKATPPRMSEMLAATKSAIRIGCAALPRLLLYSKNSCQDLSIVNSYGKAFSAFHTLQWTEKKNVFKSRRIVSKERVGSQRLVANQRPSGSYREATGPSTKHRTQNGAENERNALRFSTGQ